MRTCLFKVQSLKSKWVSNMASFSGLGWMNLEPSISSGFSVPLQSASTNYPEGGLGWIPFLVSSVQSHPCSSLFSHGQPGLCYGSLSEHISPALCQCQFNLPTHLNRETIMLTWSYAAVNQMVCAQHLPSPIEPRQIAKALQPTHSLLMATWMLACYLHRTFYSFSHRETETRSEPQTRKDI